MSNNSNQAQLKAVAQSCSHFDSGGTISSVVSVDAENISCNICQNWNGERCTINVYDSVLTSLDQT